MSRKLIQNFKFQNFCIFLYFKVIKSIPKLLYFLCSGIAPKTGYLRRIQVKFKKYGKSFVWGHIYYLSGRA